MNRRFAILAAGACLAAASASGADSIRTTTQRGPLPVTIQKMSPLEVEVSVGVTPRTISVNEIVYISYDREPAALSTARTALLAGRYEDALTSLARINADDQDRREIKQDVEFYRALCSAELALGGSGEIAAAGKQMAAFVTSHTGSYHWLRANELVGDMLVADGKFDRAEAYYSELAKAPWPDYKMRAGVAIGRAQLAQGTEAKRVEALKSFESVLASDATGELAQSQRLAATVGKARCLAAGKQYDEAIQIVNDVIAKADPEQVELNSRAYNTLGTALKNAGRLKEARMAFLHVDVLYFTVPETHAEALANLAELWEKENKPQRAARARQMLEERYKNSPWAK